MKFFLRADGDDQFDGSNLSQLDFIDVYSSDTEECEILRAILRY